MQFFKTLSNSIYSPSFYKDAVKKPFFSALKYFLLLILLLSVIAGTSKGKIFFGSFPQVVGNFIKNVQDVYPKDLIIEIKNGQAKINQPEPYFLPFPGSVKKLTLKTGIENILVVDTKTPFSIAQFDKYKTAIWLMKDKVATKEDDSGGQVKLSDLSQVKQDVVVNKELIDNMFAAIGPYVDKVVKFGGPVLFVVFIGILFAGLSLKYLFYLLLFAVVIYVIGKIAKFPLTYGESYVAGMYAVTLALIVSTVFFVFGGFFSTHAPKYLFSVLTLIVAAVNFVGAKKSS